jgi:hypothetical protein
VDGIKQRAKMKFLDILNEEKNIIEDKLGTFYVLIVPKTDSEIVDIVTQYSFNQDFINYIIGLHKISEVYGVYRDKAEAETKAEKLLKMRDAALKQADIKKVDGYGSEDKEESKNNFIKDYIRVHK